MQNHKSPPSDEEIIDQVLEGKLDAFEILLLRYQKHVSIIVNKRIPNNDHMEIAQDVFIRVYQSLPTYKRERPFKHWLTSIAIRSCYDYWRKAYRSKEIPMSQLTKKHRDWITETLSAQSEQKIEEKGAADEARELLDWALRKLSPEDRIILELVYLEGLSGKEVADLLGWSIANVKVRSFRSRKKLEKMIFKLMSNDGG